MKLLGVSIFAALLFSGCSAMIEYPLPGGGKIAVGGNPTAADFKAIKELYTR